MKRRKDAKCLWATPIALAVALVLTPVARSVPVPLFTLDSLIERADVVAIGRVISVSEESVRNGEINQVSTRIHVMSAHMQVDLFLKGGMSLRH